MFLNLVEPRKSGPQNNGKPRISGNIWKDKRLNY